MEPVKGKIKHPPLIFGKNSKEITGKIGRIKTQNKSWWHRLHGVDRSFENITPASHIKTGYFSKLTQKNSHKLSGANGKM